MASFVDQSGRVWSVECSYHTAKRWKSELGVSIWTFLEDNLKQMGSVASDIETQVDMLWVAVSGQHDVSEEEFAQGLIGDSFGEALKALWEAISDFFPDEQTRKLVASTLAKAKTIGRLLNAKALATIEGLDPEMLSETLSHSVESSDGTPTSEHIEKHSSQGIREGVMNGT